MGNAQATPLCMASFLPESFFESSFTKNKAAPPPQNAKGRLFMTIAKSKPVPQALSHVADVFLKQDWKALNKELNEKDAHCHNILYAGGVGEIWFICESSKLPKGLPPKAVAEAQKKLEDDVKKNTPPFNGSGAGKSEGICRHRFDWSSPTLASLSRRCEANAGILKG